MIIRFAISHHVVTASRGHAAGRAITMPMPRAGDRNIRHTLSAKMNIYSHPERRIQVKEGEEQREHFFHDTKSLEHGKITPVRNPLL